MCRAGPEGSNEAGCTLVLGLFPRRFALSNGVRQESYPSWPALDTSCRMPRGERATWPWPGLIKGWFLPFQQSIAIVLRAELAGHG